MFRVADASSRPGLPQFCNAPVTLKEEVDINTGLYRTIGTYSCTGVHRDEPSRVADWNVLRDNILNFGQLLSTSASS